jgi:hypothetical protein
MIAGSQRSLWRWCEQPIPAWATVGRACRVRFCGLRWLALLVALTVGPIVEAKGAEPGRVRSASIPLALEQAAKATSGTDGQKDDAASLSELPFDWQAWAVVVLAVAGIFGLRFFSRQRAQPLPKDVFELLGEATLGGGQPVRIVRFGPKTLLVTSGSGGPRTLAELDDPLATEWIAAACRGDRTLRAVHAPAGPNAKAGKDAAGSTSKPFPTVSQPLKPSLSPAEVA